MQVYENKILDVRKTGSEKLIMDITEFKEPLILHNRIFSKKESISKIDAYIRKIKEEILKTSIQLETDLNRFTDIIKQAKVNEKEILFFGMEYDFHIINHANVDFMKINNLRVISLGMPAITAFGNDYPFPSQLKEILKRRHFGNRDVLIGIQFGENSILLAEALQYNHEKNGINVLISNYKKVPEYVDIGVFIDTDDKFIARDLTQIVLHYISVNIAYETEPQFHDQGAKSFIDYCNLLLESLKGLDNYIENMAESSLLIKTKLLEGNNFFVFGNGGSAAIASFFTDGLREEFVYSSHVSSRIFDITSFAGNITKSINQGCYKSDALTKIIQSLGADRGDILFGISSSGNSENIIHPFMNLKETIRIGILGFDDGGVIGRMTDKDLAVILPDAGGFRSYQRAEDGQRIAISSILNTF